MTKTLTLLWWNLYNLHDDVDDPRIKDVVRPTRHYHRDLREVAEIVDRIEPIPDVIGCAEVENHQVMRDLADEIHRHSTHRLYRCEHHIDSRDPRGIDIGALIRDVPDITVERFSPFWPNDLDAVRPMVRIDLRIGDRLPLTVVLVHAKSRRSGATHDDDATAGSRLRLSYGRAIRQLMQENAAQSIPLIVLGDFNDEPDSYSLLHGADAVVGRPEPKDVDPHRLYNLSREGLRDSKGTCTHQDDWLLFDQILVSGGLLIPNNGGLSVFDRMRIIAENPLLYHGQPNRWYSDHLPVLITLAYE